MIERINSRTSLTNLQSYADNVSNELILPLIKKFVSVTPSLTDGKRNLLTQLLNTYFADVEYVTSNDLVKIDPKIEKWTLGSKCLKGKRVYEKPEFDSKLLNSDVIVKMLDYWKEDSLISVFSSTSVINNLAKVPGHWLYSGEEVKFSDDWTKEKVTKVSDKLNEIWNKRKSSDKWNELNDSYKKAFTIVYIILNYALNRKEVVDKEVISNLSTNDKVEFAYLLKMPIDLSLGKDYFREITKWAVPFVVKKDYPDVRLYLEKPSIIALVDKLIDNQLYFKLSKSQKEAVIRRIKGLSNSAGEKKILDTIDKFPRTARVGNKVTSDDGRITIELF